MAYTQMIMAPIMNYQTGLESIGSVAANFARTEAEEKCAKYTRFLHESPESEYLLHTHGQAALDYYLALEKASNEQRSLDDEERRERKRRQLERCRRIRKRLKTMVRVNVAEARTSHGMEEVKATRGKESADDAGLG
ncbi:MAG: hypothetical protein Q9193_002536 [Seirophora villosa]